MKDRLDSIGEKMATHYTRHPHTMHAIALVSLIAMLYGKVLGHEFLSNWDDVDYITQNPLIREISVANLKQIFLFPYNGNYAPLHLLSYLLDQQIWGLNPAAFKMVNVLQHAASTLVFYKLLNRLGLTAVQAFIAALLFAIHPVQVESVAWASQRKNTLSLLFFLVAWYSWDKWRRDDGHEQRWYIVSLLCFTLALCTKSVALVLPFVLIAQELTLNGHKLTLNTLKWLAPYLLLLACFIVLTLIAHESPGGGTVPYHGGSFAVTAMNMLPVFSRYLALLLMPTSLTIIYNAPLKYAPDLSICASGLLLLLATIGWFWLGRRNPRYFFWPAVFVIGLLPVTNIIPITTLMNDRYLYYPMLGCAPFAVLAGTEALKRLRPHSVTLPAAVTLAATVFFSCLTWQQVDVWRNSLTLWQDAFVKAPPGTWYEKSTNTDFIKEGYVESLIVEATRLQGAGELLAAQHLCRTALSHDPDNYNALGLLAQMYMQNNRPLEARPYLLRLVEHYPDSETARFYLGQNYLMTGDKENAAHQFNMVIRINPRHEQAAQNLKDLATTPASQ